MACMHREYCVKMKRDMEAIICTTRNAKNCQGLARTSRILELPREDSPLPAFAGLGFYRHLTLKFSPDKIEILYFCYLKHMFFDTLRADIREKLRRIKLRQHFGLDKKKRLTGIFGKLLKQCKSFIG